MTLIRATLTDVGSRRILATSTSPVLSQAVVFEGCEIDGLDLRGLLGLSFIDSRVDKLLGRLRSRWWPVRLAAAPSSVSSLRGAIIGHSQLVDLAPLLAAQLGLEVRPDPATDRDG
jgi:hypothetical protein